MGMKYRATPTSTPKNVTETASEIPTPKTVTGTAPVILKTPGYVFTSEFTVLEVDSEDGTVQLSNPEFRERGLADTVWCLCAKPLRVGQRVHGAFNFDPKESFRRLTFPIFTPY